jgi:L-ribulokinase
MKQTVIGIDYGTDSVRAIVADCATGQELGSAVHHYARWKRGEFCDPAANRFRQHPLDYLEGLEQAVKGALAAAPAGTASSVKGISVDTTGSTPVAVDQAGRPLSLSPEFANDPDAMFILWKDHSSIDEAEEINAKTAAWQGPNYLQYVGGIYSSEWFWAKIMRVNRTNPKVAKAAYTWIEHSDWIPAVLAGIDSADQIKRGRCAWGHKTMWHESWGGLPPSDYLAMLDPSLPVIREHSPATTWTADTKVGGLCAEWAAKLGLPAGVAIGVGAFDCHMGAVGAGVEPGWLVKVIGTSTCDIMIAPHEQIGDKLVKGICGQVDGSVVPGFTGLEAGQSAFGDLYAWFRELVMWPLRTMGLDAATVTAVEKRIMAQLNEAAARTPLAADNPVAVDWVNGRRTPDANQALKGALLDLTIGSDTPRLFRAIVEASAFGAKAIADRITSEGVPIEGVLAIGGVARKSAFAMQTLADVMDHPIRVAASDQACALGAAIFAAVVGGVYPDVRSAQKAMACQVEMTYQPNAANAKVYQTLYAKYQRAGAFIEQAIASDRKAANGGN